MHDLALTINGCRYRFDIDSTTLLVDVIRDKAQLTGTHVGCDTSQCGACTVLLNGASVKACNVLALQAANQTVSTIEGFGQANNPSRLQLAFSQAHALQCGFCTPGMVVRAHEIVEEGNTLNRQQIAQELEGNLCRCTGYTPIIDAIEAVCKSA